MSDKTVQLIEVVKKYPVLYDPSHENYKNNKIKNKIWDSIAEQIHERDGDIVKAKWKNLRDSYGKHLRTHYPQPGHASKLIERYKTWPWVKQMSFLQPFLEYSATQSNMPASTREFENYTDQFDKTCQPPSYQKLGTALQHVSVQYQDISVPEQCSSSQNSQHNQRRPRDPQFDDVISYYNGMTEYDETDLIFLGYSKTIKKMSLRRQALVKFSIAKIIMKAEIEHVEETSSRDNANKPTSPSFNSPSDRNKSPQECYNFPSNCAEESSDFPDRLETKVELQEFSHISPGLDPMSLTSPQNFSQRNYQCQQKSLPATTVAEDVTCSQLHSPFDDHHENQSGKKLKQHYKELEKK